MDYNKFIQDYISKSCQTGGNVSGGNSFMNFDTHPNMREDQIQQAYFDRFIDQSQFLRDINTFRVSECSGKIPRLDWCNIVTSGKCTKDCIGNDFDADESFTTYELKNYVSTYKVGYEFLDCNKIGTPDFINSMLRNRMIESHANDIARVAIMGNEDLPTGPSQSSLNNLLGVDDGILKLACECTPEAQILDAKGAGFSPELYMAARKLLPAQFRSMRDQFEFIGGISQTDWLAQNQSYRPTDLGDEARTTGRVGRLWGNAFYELPEWPENLLYQYENADGEVQSKEVTHLLFAMRSNFNYIQRTEPRIHTEYDQICDSWVTTYRTQADFTITDERQIVLIKNVDVCGEGWDQCVRPAPDNCTFDLSAVNPCDC